MHLTDSERRPRYSEMTKGDWWWDVPDQFHAGATFVPVICASEKTHLSHSLGCQHALLHYITIGNIQKDIRWTPYKPSWNRIGLNSSPLKCAENADEVWNSAV